MSNIVKISEAASLALHAALLLAGGEAEQLQGTGEMARQLGVSEAHLSKVLQRLHRHGLLVSVRGPQGGFKLARPAAEISLLELYEAIEGALEVTHCLFNRPVCGQGCCILGPLLMEASATLKSHLEKTTLADAAGIAGNNRPTH